MTRAGALALLLLTGCAAPSLYSWGHYEAVVYATYAKPGAVPPERQIELLEQDYQKARSENKPVPPGFHAHLGYLYYQLGQTGRGAPGVRDREGQVPGVRRVHGPAARPADRTMSAAGRGSASSPPSPALLLSGCVTAKPYDYTNYRAFPPRSILVLPPVNEGTDIRGTYGYLSTVTRPLAELGYYVYPVVLVDHFFKETGCPRRARCSRRRSARSARSSARMRSSTSPSGNTGRRYQLLASTTSVVALARLVDTRTGTLLWEGTLAAEEGSAGSGNILGDLIGAAFIQVINQSTDRARSVAEQANAQFAVEGRGLLHGPYSPKYGQK